MSTKKNKKKKQAYPFRNHKKTGLDVPGGPCTSMKNIKETFPKRRILLTNSLWDETPSVLGFAP